MERYIVAMYTIKDGVAIPFWELEHGLLTHVDSQFFEGVYDMKKKKLVEPDIVHQNEKADFKVGDKVFVSSERSINEGYIDEISEITNDGRVEYYVEELTNKELERLVKEYGVYPKNIKLTAIHSLMYHLKGGEIIAWNYRIKKIVDKNKEE